MVRIKIGRFIRCLHPLSDTDLFSTLYFQAFYEVWHQMNQMKVFPHLQCDFPTSNRYCQQKNIICKEGEEIFDGKCFIKCKENESRSSFGECKPIEEPVSQLAGDILQYFLITVLGLLTLNFLIKRLRKKR